MTCGGVEKSRKGGEDDPAGPPSTQHGSYLRPNYLVLSVTVKNALKC